MTKRKLTWIEELDPEYVKPGKKDTAGITCHTPLNERSFDKDHCPFVHQPGGSVWIKREVIFKAMDESGFTRTDSCCDPELNKMCASDQYKGNLEGFVNRLMKLIGVSPST
jgi:hypothetical protein